MKDSHKLIGFIVPTTKIEVMSKYLLASVDNLLDIKNYCTFLINFQGEWIYHIGLAEQLVYTLESKGFNVRYKFHDYNIVDNKVPMNKIRNDCAKMMPDAEFYALIDDDLEFTAPNRYNKMTAGEEYLVMVHYMIINPKCGAIMMKNSGQGIVDRYQIAPYKNFKIKYCMVDRGILMRNFNPSEGLVLPYESESLVGSDEDKVTISWLLYNGYYIAIKSQCKSLHGEHFNSKDENKIRVSGADTYNWNTDKILDENNNKFIREHFYPSFKNKGYYATEMIDYLDYLGRGGLDIKDDSVRDSLIYNCKNFIKNDFDYIKDLLKRRNNI